MTDQDQNQDQDQDKKAPEEDAAAPEGEGAASAPAEDAPDAQAEAPAAEAGGAPTYEELESEVAALKDQLLRALAESENVRRRAERDKADFSKYAISGFAREMLGVVDNLRRALEAVGEEARAENETLANLYEGIEMTQRQLVSNLEQFGVTPIEALGKKFDHNFHQAMFEIEDPDQPAGMVVQELTKGYMLHDRLLRPAMVGVSKGGPKGEEPPAEAEEGAETAADGQEPPKRKPSPYEKAAEAADQEGEDSPGVDKEL